MQHLWFLMSRPHVAMDWSPENHHLLNQVGLRDEQGHMPQPWGDLHSHGAARTETKNPQKNVHTVSSSEFMKAPASSEADMALPGHSKITSGKYPRDQKENWADREDGSKRWRVEGGRLGWKAWYGRTRVGKSPSKSQHGAVLLCQLKEKPLPADGQGGRARLLSDTCPRRQGLPKPNLRWDRPLTIVGT